MNITLESTASEHLTGVGGLSKGILAQKFIKIQFGPQNCKHKFISVCLESIKQVVNPMT